MSQPPHAMTNQQQQQRARHLGVVRRSFTRTALIRTQVGWVGDHELHDVNCPEYVAAQARKTAVPVGMLDRVFVALADDYVEGRVAFPALHDCLRPCV